MSKWSTDQEKLTGLSFFSFHFLFGVSISMTLRLHISTSPCLHITSSPSLHVSMSLHFHVSMSPSPCLHVHVSTFPEFRKWKMELTEKGNFRFFLQLGTRNGKLPFVCCNQKWTFVNLARQLITSNRQLLSQQRCPSMDLKYWFMWVQGAFKIFQFNVIFKEFRLGFGPRSSFRSRFSKARI